MKSTDLFEQFWKVYQHKTIDERRTYFNSLSRRDQSKLLKSLYKNGWYDMFMQNYVDDIYDYIKGHLNVDLIDMRIKAIKYKRVFLVDKVVWDAIELLMSDVDSYYNTDVFFGGLTVSIWGKKKQFYKIHAN